MNNICKGCELYDGKTCCGDNSYKTNKQNYSNICYEHKINKYQQALKLVKQNSSTLLTDRLSVMDFFTLIKQILEAIDAVLY